MIRALLIDDDSDHAERLERELNQRGLGTIYAAGIREAIRKLKSRTAQVELVIICMADPSRPWLAILHQLQQTSWQSGIREFPLFLCVSRYRPGAEHQLKIERMGARHVFE